MWTSVLVATFRSCVVLAALFGCAARQPVAVASVVPGAPPPDDRAPLEWARNEEFFVIVRRSCRTLSVYRRGEWLRTYGHLAFGRLPGVKVFEGDLRTPNGLYRIVGKREHPRWSRFMLLDYPNLSDLDAYRKEVENGLVVGGPGSEIGIHGTDEPRFNELGVDWTFGCVSLLNPDVEDLYDIVPDGTLVLIED
jgi:murein L,D-transpeptidase YafK